MKSKEEKKTYYFYLDKELSDINEGEIVVFDDNNSSGQIIEINHKSALLQLLDTNIASNKFQPVWFYRSKYKNHWQTPFIKKGWEFMNYLECINLEICELDSLRYSLSSYLGSIVANEAIKIIGKGIPYKYGLLYGSHNNNTYQISKEIKKLNIGLQ